MSGGRAKHAGARGTPGVKRAACAKYTNCAKHARCCSSRARCATCARLANGPRNGKRAVRAGAQGAERPNQTRGKRPPDDWPSHGQNTLAAPKATATHSSRPGQIVARQWINASLPTPEAIHDNLTVRSTAGGALQVYTTHNAHAEPDRTRATDHAKTSSEDRQFHGAKSVGLRKKNAFGHALFGTWTRPPMGTAAMRRELETAQ